MDMEQLNKIELRGNVGSVMVRTFEGKRAARITLATNYAYKDRDGMAMIETTWHNINAWEGKYIHDLESIKKGDMLLVVGRLRNQHYTAADGSEKDYAEVLASRLQILEPEDGFNYEM
jgi:single-strand DNA-binding protein